LVCSRPVVEPIALKALKLQDSEIVLCKEIKTADIIIRIKPSFFYTPQMHVYHSKLTATDYSCGANVMGSYVGEV
jgi:hypothetical protein